MYISNMQTQTQSDSQINVIVHDTWIVSTVCNVWLTMFSFFKCNLLQLSCLEVIQHLHVSHHLIQMAREDW